MSNAPCLTLLAFATLCIAAPDFAVATPRCEGKLLRRTIDERQETTLVLLRARDLPKLQSRMDGFLDAYVAGKLSDEELFYEFGAFDRWSPSLTPIFKEWVEAYPTSYAAHLALSLHLASVAWKTRGSARAPETSKQQMQEFQRGLRRARDTAIKASGLHPKPILAYRQIVANAVALPVQPADYQALGIVARGPFVPSSRNPRPDVVPVVAAANRIQADNVVVRMAYVHVLSPRWGGSLEALEEYSRPSSHAGLPAEPMAAVLYTAAMEMGNDFEFRDKPDEAIVFYELAARTCRLNQPLIDTARIRVDQRRWADALAAADAAIAIAPGSVNGQRYKAYALSGLGRHAEAVAILKQLSVGGDSDVAYFLGEYYARGEGGLPLDLHEAKRLFSIAARAGDQRAIDRLAKMP